VGQDDLTWLFYLTLKEEIKKKKEKKYHNKLAEAIRNMQFGPSLASLTKLFKSRDCFGISAL